VIAYSQLTPEPQPQVTPAPSQVPEPAQVPAPIPSQVPVPAPSQVPVQVPAPSPKPQTQVPVPAPIQVPVQVPAPSPKPQTQVPVPAPIQVPVQVPVPAPGPYEVPEPEVVPQPQWVVPEPDVVPEPQNSTEPEPEPVPVPAVQPNDPNSSAKSNQETQKIYDSAQDIQSGIQSVLDPDEATVSIPIPKLDRDVITVEITATIGNGSADAQQTLNKICNSLKQQLSDKSGGRSFGDCVWNELNQKRQVGTSYKGTTVSNAETDDTTGASSICVSLLASIFIVIGAGLFL